MIETLRSSLAKNSMIALGDLIKTLQTEMNQCLDLIINKIMKKGMEKNNFLLQEVSNVLIQTSTYCSEHKLLPFLFNFYHNKNKEIKLNVLLCFHTILERNQ